jgi:MFS family permease
VTSLTATHPEATRPGWDARTWGLLVVLCGVLFLDGLDVSMVGVALPSIQADLGLSTSQLQWVVSGYVLGYGGLLLLGGRTADLLGRRRVLLIALAVFTVASLLGGLVDDGGMLIATRFVKGAAAAFTAPAGLSIITTRFAEGPERNRALSIYTACGASGFSFGLVLGGLLTEIGWRWTFLLPVPIAAAILAVAPRLIPHDRGETSRGRYDIAGAVSVTAAMLLLVRTVVEAPEAGWGSAATMASFGLVAALLAAFVAIEQRVASPLVRLGILRSASLARANVGAMTVFGAYVGFQFVGTLYLQSLLGWSALETALGFLPGGILVAVGAPRIGAIADRVGTARIITVGSAAFVAGYALFLRIDTSFAYVAMMLPTMLLVGVGFALCFPSLNIQATAGVRDHEQGLASGLVNASFQVGGAIVLAVVSAVVSSQAGSSTDPGTLVDAYRAGIAVVTGVAVIGLAVGLAGSRLRPTVPATSVGRDEPGPVAADARAANDADGDELVIDLAARAGTPTSPACAAAPTGDVA